MIINSTKTFNKFLKYYEQKESENNNFIKRKEILYDTQNNKLMSDQEKLAYCYNYVGCLNDYKGDVSKGLENFQKSLEILFDEYGVGSCSTGAVTNNIGSIFYQMKDTKQALEFHKSSQTIMKNLHLGKTTVMADILYNLGLDYIQIGEYSNALDVLKKATEIYLNLTGEDNLQVAQIFGAIGNCL